MLDIKAYPSTAAFIAASLAAGETREALKGCALWVSRKGQTSAIRAAWKAVYEALLADEIADALRRSRKRTARPGLAAVRAPGVGHWGHLPNRPRRTSIMTSSPTRKPASLALRVRRLTKLRTSVATGSGSGAATYTCAVAYSGRSAVHPASDSY